MTNTAKQILSILTEAQGPVRTSFLIARFGAQTTAALDLLTARQQIIRVRGCGATIELA